MCAAHDEHPDARPGEAEAADREHDGQCRHPARAVKISRATSPSKRDRDMRFPS